jgi:DNA mismatch repair protein MutS2
VACASFGYDPATYEPTYRLSHGIPGRSLALEMAERLGLPAKVVADARSRLSAKEAQAEAMLKQLEEDRAALEAEARRLQEEVQALEQREKAQRAAEQSLEVRRRSEAESFARELRKRGEDAARAAADAIRQAVQRVEASRRSAVQEGARARSEAVRTIREAQETALRGVTPPAEVAGPPADLRLGSRVRVRALGVIGEVMAIPDSQEAELAVGGKRMRVPQSELVVIGGPTLPTATVNLSARRRVQSEASEAAEINVVGLTVDEALPQVDKFLDDAALAEARQVRVIHGFGQGKLRKAVAGLLEGHPHVAAFRLGAGREGGAGATIVELKE